MSEHEPPQLPSEVWRLMPDCTPDYWISSLGRAWSRPRAHSRGGLLKLRPDRYGYFYIRPMLANGKQRTMKIAPLVVRAFRGTCPPDMEVRHLDGDSTNNKIDNLIWGTASENQLDKVRHGTHQNSRKTHCKRNHPFTPENTYYPPQWTTSLPDMQKGPPVTSGGEWRPAPECTVQHAYGEEGWRPGVGDVHEHLATPKNIEVTITRSAGADGAVVVFIDGLFNEDDQPPLRILVNDEQVFAQVAYEPTPDGRDNECNAMTLSVEPNDITYTGDYTFPAPLAASSRCDCCGRLRDKLPFHHDAHDDSGMSWDYCQECDDAGCTLVECEVR